MKTWKEKNDEEMKKVAWDTVGFYTLFLTIFLITVRFMFIYSGYVERSIK